MASSSSWSRDEIRQNASNWTLEGDAQLLETLQTISANLDKRATATTTKLRRLALDLDRTNVSLGNITNKLSALQHTQFVENRVYEDDETIANVAEVPIDGQEDKKKYDPLETLGKVLNNSMRVLGQYYEKVSIDIEDSEEEDDNEDGDAAKSVIYRPKNPYDNRPLPYTIGTKEWIEKWHVGVCDSDEDYSGDEKDEEEFSASSEDESNSPSLPSIAPTISESEQSLWGNQPAINVSGAAGSYGSESEDELSASKMDRDLLPSHQSGMQQYEPPQYYVHQPKQRDRGLFDESTDESTDSELYNVNSVAKKVGPVAATAGGQKISNIISSEPPPDLVSDSRKAKPKVDLFVDDNEEPVSKKIPSVSHSKTPSTEEPVRKVEPTMSNTRKKTVNLFDDDDFDSFMKELNTKTQQKSSSSQEKVKNLFYESSEDDESLDRIVDEKKPTVKVLPKESKQKPIPPLDSDAFIPATEPTMPKVSIASKKNLFDELSPPNSPVSVESKLPQATPRKSLFDDQQDNDLSNVLKPTTPKKTLIRSLFDDEPPDDDFDSLFKSTTTTNKNVNKEAVVKKSIFDDFEEEAVDQNSWPEKEAVTDEDAGVKVVEPESVSVSKPIESLSKSTNIFDDVSDDDAANFFDPTKIEEKVVPPDVLKSENNQQIDESPSKSSSEEVKTLQANLFVDNDFDDDESSVLNKQHISGGIESKESVSTVEYVINEIEEPEQILPEPVEEKPSKSKASEEAIKKSSLPQTTTSASNIFSSALFSDTPPDDDDIFGDRFDNNDDFVNNSQRDEKHTSSSGDNAVTSTPSALNFNTISLFDDTPPDDDFEATPHDGKKLHSIFYDDFSETIIPPKMESSESSKPLSSYIFDEPPPDSLPVLEPTKPKEKPEKSKQAMNEFSKPPLLPDKIDGDEEKKPRLEEGKSQKKISSLIDKIQNASVDTVDESKIRPQPKRMNTNFNINVAALLPGAKRPQTKPPENESSETVVIKPSLDNIASDVIPSTPPRNVQIESDPSRLQSLNKTRAKIQVQRRPSSRKARQVNYQKSLLENEKGAGDTKSEMEKSQEEPRLILGQKLFANEPSENDFFETLDTKKAEVTQNEDIPDFLKQSEPKLPSGKKAGRSAYDDLFGDEPPEADLPTTNFVPVRAEIKQPIDVPKAIQETAPTKSVLFFDDEPPDDSFVPIIEPRKQPAPQSYKSFLDEESSDNDDLFSTLVSDTIRPVASVEQEVTTGKEKQKSNETAIPAKITKPPAMASPFGDFSDSEDTAGLFAKTVKTSSKKLEQSKSKVEPKSLFGSDDEDDDLFGASGGMEQTKTIAATKTDSEISKPVSKGGNSSQHGSKNLFDDSDDDDDLFGTVVGNKQKAALTNTKNPSTKKSVPTESSQSSSSAGKDFNDPLADLLKD